ncbi:MAG: hypothetical protein ACSLFQ_09105, partial [Thermoanaerobaculia bacterium]
STMIMWIELLPTSIAAIRWCAMPGLYASDAGGAGAPKCLASHEIHPIPGGEPIYRFAALARVVIIRHRTGGRVDDERRRNSFSWHRDGA